jgi:hypothetical protein
VGWSEGRRYRAALPAATDLGAIGHCGRHAAGDRPAMVHGLGTGEAPCGIRRSGTRLR